MSDDSSNVKVIKIRNKDINKKPTKTKREKATTTKGHYVTNAVLLPEVIRAKQLGQVTEDLMLMIEAIAERYSRKYCFIGYSFREDMVAAAIENLCKNALKFDHEKYSNPFAYYTTAVHNSFLQFLSDEAYERNVRDKMLMEAGANPSFNYQDGNDEGGPSDSDDYHWNSSTSVDSSSAKDDDCDDEEEKVRDTGRRPGDVTVYAGSEMVLDPIRQIYVHKSKLQS